MFKKVLIWKKSKTAIRPWNIIWSWVNTLNLISDLKILYIVELCYGSRDSESYDYLLRFCLEDPGTGSSSFSRVFRVLRLGVLSSKLLLYFPFKSLSLLLFSDTSSVPSKSKDTRSLNLKFELKLIRQNKKIFQNNVLINLLRVRAWQNRLSKAMLAITTASISLAFPWAWSSLLVTRWTFCVIECTPCVTVPGRRPLSSFFWIPLK